MLVQQKKISVIIYISINGKRDNKENLKKKKKKTLVFGFRLVYPATIE